MRKQIIGTDLSITECKKEGYLMMETEGKFDSKKSYRVFAEYPEYIKDENPEIGNAMQVDTYINVDEVVRLYNKHKAAIDKASGINHNINVRSYHELLHLADDVNMYCGLD